MKDVLAWQCQVHFVCWVNRLDADRALVFSFESLRILSLLGSTWASVGLGDAEGLVLLPVGALAVLAAVEDEAAVGAARHGQFLLPTVAADNSVVAGRGLLLHRHGFGRSSTLFFRRASSLFALGKQPLFAPLNGGSSPLAPSFQEASMGVLEQTKKHFFGAALWPCI